MIYEVKRILKKNELIKKFLKGIINILMKNKSLKIIAIKHKWNYHKRLLKYSDQDFAEKIYKNYMGISLDLDSPKTFDEKLWWLKLNNRSSLLTLCTDKFLVRDYVSRKGYKDILIPLVGVFESVSDIHFDRVPDNSFFKCNHTSGCNMAFNTKKSFDVKYFKRVFAYTLKQNHYVLSREWNYKNIKPKIICEQQLDVESSKSLADFRFFCFNGKPKYIAVDIDTVDSNGINAFPKRNIYDLDFNKLDIQLSKDNFDVNIVEKPKNLDLMIKIARDLASDFPFCRVDLYNVGGKIYFGEITFFPGGGFNNFTPNSYSNIFGDLIEL